MTFRPDVNGLFDRTKLSQSNFVQIKVKILLMAILFVRDCFTCCLQGRWAVQLAKRCRETLDHPSVSISAAFAASFVMRKLCSWPYLAAARGEHSECSAGSGFPVLVSSRDEIAAVQGWAVSTGSPASPYSTRPDRNIRIVGAEFSVNLLR